MRYEHPVYTPESLAARHRLPEVSDGVLAFAGAYHGWGFHEDGALSGLKAAALLGRDWARLTATSGPASISGGQNLQSAAVEAP
jgi:predicted NAD/FAD-binding protein